MQNTYLDWKDIAESFYDKCLSITVLVIIFVFIVFPNIETKVIKAKEKVMTSIEVLTEIKDEIKPPTEVAKPLVNFEIVEGGDEGDEDVQVIETIESTELKAEEIAIAPANANEGQTSRFVAYDESPVETKFGVLKYPEFGKKGHIEGTVILDVEILANGSVGAVEVKKSLFAGPGGFDEAAINFIKNTKFQPAKSNGKPVAVWVTYPVTFSLD